MSKLVTLDRTINWINKTQGRDKFCKAIQYACRFLKYHAENSGNKELALKFNGLFTGMRDARKLFRLFKSINEYQKLLEILKKDGNSFEKSCNVITRLGFLFYWFFDNIAILSTIKLLNRDSKKYNKIGATFWAIALISTLVLTIRNLIINTEQLKAISAALRTSLGGENEKSTADKKAALKKKRQEIFLNLAKTIGDLIPAGQGSELIPKLTGKNCSDGLIGLGGFVSAVITSYQLFD